jgi:hypothetical protein
LYNNTKEKKRKENSNKIKKSNNIFPDSVKDHTKFVEFFRFEQTNPPHLPLHNVAKA